MRSLLLASACTFLFVGCGRTSGTGDAPGPVLARWHFAGAASLKGGTDAEALRAVLASTNCQALIEAALGKLNARLTRGAHPAPAAGPLPRLLLNELLRVESLVEARGTNVASPDWVLALRLGAGPAAWWQTNAPALGAQLGRTASATTAHDWFILSLGAVTPPPVSDLAAQIKKEGRPANLRPAAWMQLELDLPKLAPAFGLPAAVQWPVASLAWAGRGGNLRMEGLLRFAKPVVPAVEPWRIPTNSIREPLIGFGALQGVGGWLAAQPWYQRLGVTPAPNQVFSWAQSQIPFQTYLAWQWPDLTNALRAIEPKLPPLASEYLPKVTSGQIAHATNLARINWTGLPIWLPFLGPAPDPGYVVAGLMPTEGKFSPAPPELFAEVTSRTNLVYYDWEISQARLEDWRMTGTFYRMVAGYQSPATNSLSYRWLTDTNITGQLGNAVTEVTRLSPTELKVLRSSSVGLTGLEMFSAVLWLDDPAFPGNSAPPPASRRGADAPPTLR